MNNYMEIALKEAKKSLKTDDVPVGAVIVEKGKIIAKSHNTREKQKNITRHAEINAIEKACKKKKTWHLNDCELYVTLEPCKMCMGAIEESRIKVVVYGTSRKTTTKRTIKMQNIHQKEAQNLLTNFFKNKRK